MAAGVSPPGAVDARKRRLAARRTSAKPVSSLGSRKRPKSSPGARPCEARVHSVPSVIRLEMAMPPGNGRDGEVGAGRLEHEGVRRVGDEERGVVGLLVGGVGDAALSARLEEAGR